MSYIPWSLYVSYIPWYIYIFLGLSPSLDPLIFLYISRSLHIPNIYLHVSIYISSTSLCIDLSFSILPSLCHNAISLAWHVHRHSLYRLCSVPPLYYIDQCHGWRFPRPLLRNPTCEKLCRNNTDPRTRKPGHKTSFFALLMSLTTFMLF